jgi:phi13 family phage major tail protein|nr:MAG TPA: major tail protein [Caudoviricetes sp.]
MKVEEFRGVRGAVIAEVTKDTAEEITFGEVMSLAGVSEISKSTESSNEPHYYDNQPMVTVSSTGNDEIGVNTSALPLDIYAKITGQNYNEEKGVLIEGEREQKYFAFGYITKLTDGTEMYVWRLKGTFNIPDDTHTTEDDGTEANGQELTFTGINTTHKFEKNVDNSGNKKSARAVTLNTSVDKTMTETAFFSKVQTPDTLFTA